MNHLSSLSLKMQLTENNIVIMGDFNMHFPGENQAIDRYHFYDLWLQQHSHFDGLTSDSKKNILRHYMMPLDNRRMRLKRMWMKQSEDIDLGEINMIGTKSIDSYYQFPSDHFGLSATFCKSSTGFVPQNTIFMEEFDKLPKFKTGGRSSLEIKVYSAITLFLMLAFILTFILFFWWITTKVIKDLCKTRKLFSKILPNKIESNETIEKIVEPRDEGSIQIVI